MLALYLACLIFGLGLCAVQLFASHDADHAGPDTLGGGHLPSGHAPTGQLAAGAVAGAPGEAGHALAHGPAGLLDAHAAHTAEPGAPLEAGWASIFVSLRFYMFAALGVGAVGTPVTAFALSTPALTLVVALATGLGIGTLASLGFRWLGRETIGSGTSSDELVGQVGRVLLACEKGRLGKVRLTVRGQTLDLVATTDETHLSAGEAIIVLALQAGRVHVCAAPIDLLPG